MAVRFQYRGIQIEADSRKDVDQFLDDASAGKRDAPRPAAKDQLSRVRDLLESLDGQQLLFVKAIKEQPASSDADLRRKLSLDSNKALAGVRSGISKRAKAAGLEGTDLIEVEAIRTENGKGRTYVYKAGKLLREVIAA